MTIPTYLSYLVLTGTGLSLIAILYGIDKALAEASWPGSERRRAVTLASALLLGWLAVALGLASAGLYQVTANGIPTVQYGLLLPIVIGMLLIWRSELVGRIIDAVPQSWIVGVQFYRTLGVVFLMLYAAGAFPGLFALPAGLGDVAIGLSAPFVALAYARNRHDNAGAVSAWNILGILDLIVAVTMGFLTSPSAIAPIQVHPTSELITVMPMVMIPVYMVPLSILLHIASLAKLRREEGHAGTVARAQA